MISQCWLLEDRDDGCAKVLKVAREGCTLAVRSSGSIGKDDKIVDQAKVISLPATGCREDSDWSSIPPGVTSKPAVGCGKNFGKNGE